MDDDISIAIDPRYRNYKGGIDPAESERYAKIIYFCLMRGDVHAALLWLKEVIDNYYSEIEVYSADFNSITISSSDLPVRTINVLESKGYIYWSDLVGANESDIKSISGIGETEYNKISVELYKAIKKHTK